MAGRVTALALHGLDGPPGRLHIGKNGREVLL